MASVTEITKKHKWYFEGMAGTREEWRALAIAYQVELMSKHSQLEAVKSMLENGLSTDDIIDFLNRVI